MDNLSSDSKKKEMSESVYSEKEHTIQLERFKFDLPDETNMGLDDTEEDKIFRDQVRSAMRGERDFPATDTGRQLGILCEMLNGPTPKRETVLDIKRRYLEGYSKLD